MWRAGQRILRPDVLRGLVSSARSCSTWTTRTHTCGELRAEHVGARVSLAGWVQHLRQGRFVILRDAYGSVQLVTERKGGKAVHMGDVNLESVLKIEGVVRERPKEAQVPRMATGKIEVEVKRVKVVGPSPPVMPIYPGDRE